MYAVNIYQKTKAQKCRIHHVSPCRLFSNTKYTF